MDDQRKFVLRFNGNTEVIDHDRLLRVSIES
jgi:hypothetical protein